MVRKKTDDSTQISNRKTRVPVAKIKKLIKLKKDLDVFIQQIMDEHEVPMSYIRGLMKEPTITAPKTKTKRTTTKKAGGVKRKTTTTRKTGSTRKKKS